MNTTDTPAGAPETTPDRGDAATGMAHPTVVPENFDPDAPGRRRD